MGPRTACRCLQVLEKDVRPGPRTDPCDDTPLQMQSSPSAMMLSLNIQPLFLPTWLSNYLGCNILTWAQEHHVRDDESLAKGEMKNIHCSFPCPQSYFVEEGR